MDAFWRWVARFSVRHTWWVLGLTIALSIPALSSVRNLGLDTNLKRLLPEHAPSVEWSRDLEEPVGDGGYFAILLEGDHRPSLISAIEEIAAAVEELPPVQTAEYRNPKAFIDEYRYTLVPNTMLLEFRDEIERWEIEVNPFLLDLDAEEDGPQEEPGNSDRDDEMETLLDYYVHMDEFQSDPDGRIFGIIVRPKEGISNLGSLRKLYGDIQDITRGVADRSRLWWGIGGNLRTRVDEFDLIVSDLGRAGWVSAVAILLTLAISFRSVRILPVILLPLAIGLLWSFSLVPWLVGDLNTITAFLLLVLFGMGVDYAIHLVRRFQVELDHDSPEAAIETTLRSTGRSVATSGATTSIALLILAISDFRGFSDFGIIGGSSIAIITLAMLLIWPACAALGFRIGLVVAKGARKGRGALGVPPHAVTMVIVAMVGLAAVLAYARLEFDYDFTNLSAKIPGKETISEKQSQVYPATSAPAALYVARDLDALDEVVGALESKRDENLSSPTIGTINSIRNFAPSQAQFDARLGTLDEMRESLQGRWVRKIEDQDRLEMIEDFVAFDPPARPPRLDEVPDTIRRELEARDGSGELLVTVDTDGRSRDGRMAMAFTEDLYDIGLPEGVRGPTGEKLVLAEILFLVTGESGWMIALTLFGIFVLILIDRRSVMQTVWVLIPLVAGIVLTVGAMVLLGWKLNFFNMVVLPTMLGVGVDHGVHYYRRWKELDGDTRTTHEELFEPITIASLTTIMGYLGMVVAHHPGLRSIGSLALVGLTATWLTALVLLPGLLRWQQQRRLSEVANKSP